MNNLNAIQQQTALTYRERINRVMRYIQAHVDQPLRLNTLADISSFSPYHFHRIFRAYVGETVAEYIRRLRLARAGRALIETDVPITKNLTRSPCLEAWGGIVSPSSRLNAYEMDIFVDNAMKIV